MVDKEWLYFGIVIFVCVVVIIISIVKCVQWYINNLNKLKSGEITKPVTPYLYYKEHPEEFSVAHTYRIRKSPMGQRMRKQEIRIFLIGMGALVLCVAMMNLPLWLDKRGIIQLSGGAITLLALVFFAAMMAIFCITMVNLKTKVWLCPYCQKPMMRVELSAKESKEYVGNPEAIFMVHKYGRRNLLLIADSCTYCKKSFIDSEDE